MSETTTPATPVSYDEDSIQVLKGLEAVKLRPGMYIGDTDDGSGLLHMAFEILDNSVDEAVEGHATEITLTINPDNSVTVKDNGRGIPVGFNKQEGTTAAVLALTRLHAGGKFNQNNYKTSGGLHGVGAAVVNALSDWMKAKIYRDGNIYEVDFINGGDINSDLHITGKTDETGTEISFLPSLTTFAFIHMDADVIRSRMKIVACLNPGLTMNFCDLRESDKITTYHFKDGIVDMVKSLDKQRKSIIGSPISYDAPSSLVVSGKKDQEDSVINCHVSIAFEWLDDYNSTVNCFTNNIPQPDGGTHLVGAKSAVLNTIRAYYETNKAKLIKGRGKRQIEITNDDIFEGITFVLNLKLPNPKFSSQTKSKLVSQEAHKIVYPIVQECLSRWLEENPAYAKVVIEKIANASEARIFAKEAVKKKREVERKSILDIACMPGKLSDCSSNDASITELFLVEGDSAGGTAKNARDSEFQAILPLKGKILNTENLNPSKILSSKEVGTLINAIGTQGIGTGCEIESRRYDKIIIMTDADVDGGHIRSLLLTFFYRHQFPLLRDGHIYVAKPPLYGIVRKGRNEEIEFIIDEEDMENKINQILSENCHIEYDTYDDDNNKQVVTLEGAQFISFMEDVRKIGKIINRINHSLGNKTINETALMTGVIDKSILATQAEDIIEHMKSFLSVIVPKGIWSAKVADDGKNGIYFTWRVRGVEKTALLDFDELEVISRRIMSLPEYKRIMEIFYDATPVRIVQSSGEVSTFVMPTDGITTSNVIFESMVKEIKRFKGLGEMNDEQLALTAMNPETRNIFQVSLPSDIDTSNEAFAGFMGDNVQYRKEKIEMALSNVAGIDEGDE